MRPALAVERLPFRRAQQMCSWQIEQLGYGGEAMRPTAAVHKEHPWRIERAALVAVAPPAKHAPLPPPFFSPRSKAIVNAIAYEAMNQTGLPVN
jgi:hypothetical protein